MQIECAERLEKLPPYLFVEIDRLKKYLENQGKELIDLGIGDPDLPTPQEIIAEMIKALQCTRNHHYPLDQGLSSLRENIALWFKKRFAVELNPDNEILPLIGSKEGIAHFPLAVLNSGDIVLLPEPLYPPYRSGAIFAGGEIYYLPLDEENDFKPVLDQIPKNVLKKAKLLYLNYPNNPTTAIAELKFFQDVVEFALKNEIIILHDAAYSELTYDGYIAPSILQIENAKDVAIEFHSFSKTYNMTGWRLGWACGNSKLIAYLRQLKSNIDSGVFNPIQYAGIKALEIYEKNVRFLRQIYKRRRDIFVDGLRQQGWNIDKPNATFYIWAKVPNNMTSQEFCKLLLQEAAIVATPGVGFGPSGEGWIRFSLTVDEEKLENAVAKIAKIL